MKKDKFEKKIRDIVSKVTGKKNITSIEIKIMDGSYPVVHIDRLAIPMEDDFTFCRDNGVVATISEYYVVGNISNVKVKEG